MRQKNRQQDKIHNHQCFFGDDEDDVITCAPDVAGAECAARRSVQSTSQGKREKKKTQLSVLTNTSTNNNNKCGRK